MILLVAPESRWLRAMPNALDAEHFSALGLLSECRCIGGGGARSMPTSSERPFERREAGICGSAILRKSRLRTACGGTYYISQSTSSLIEVRCTLQHTGTMSLTRILIANCAIYPPIDIKQSHPIDHATRHLVCRCYTHRLLPPLDTCTLALAKYIIRRAPVHSITSLYLPLLSPPCSLSGVLFSSDGVYWAARMRPRSPRC